MDKQAKGVLRRVVFALCLFPLCVLHAAEPEDAKPSSFWGHSFSLAADWAMHDPGAHASGALITDSTFPVDAYHAGLNAERDGLISTLVKFSEEAVVIDFPRHSNQFTAGIKLGSHPAWETGIGITRYWIGTPSSAQEEREYLSLLLRYSF